MKIEIGIKTVSRLIALMLVVIGCSHDSNVKKIPVSAKPAKEIFLLNRDMLIVKKAQADVLSPKNFEKAEEHQKEANASLRLNKRPAEIMKHVAISRHYLDQARFYSGRSNLHLKGVSEARTRAIEAGAREFYEFELSKADRKLKDLTADIERDENTDSEKEAEKTQEIYLSIELMSLKKKYLDESRKIVKQAKSEGAERRAPKSLAKAEKSLKDSAAFIKAHSQDPEAMAKEAQKSFHQAKLLLKITRDVRAEASSENMAEQEHGISGNEARITNLSSGKEKMQNEEGQEKKFQRAKNRFNSKEASVYRKGDGLLIRLHGLRFTSSKSDLSSGKIALLNKVNLAIEDLDAKKVQVNGHTDSIGGKAANQKVSAQRADVIKDYLQARNDNDTLMIETRGLDYQEPIATNKTAEGRALNRRVDILIEPAQSSQE
jgi:outer membrane protein OmpA-like peptidoglycan-associated protein